MPLQRRLPKRGFRRPREAVAVVNLRQLEAKFEAGATVDPPALYACGLIKKTAAPVKILGMGQLSKALTVKAHGFSRSARERIAAAGGTAENVARA